MRRRKGTATEGDHVFCITSPRGPSLGASEEAAPISPPTALSMTTFSSPDGGGGPILT